MYFKYQNIAFWLGVKNVSVALYFTVLICMYYVLIIAITTGL